MFHFAVILQFFCLVFFSITGDEYLHWAIRYVFLVEFYKIIETYLFDLFGDGITWICVESLHLMPIADLVRYVSEVYIV